MSREAVSTNNAFIWSIAEILRGDFKQSEYQKVVLPLTVLRRLDAVLTPTKAEFLERAKSVEGMEGAENALRSFAQAIYGHRFYNTSPLDFRKLTDDAENVAGNLRQMDANEEIFKLILADDGMRALFVEFIGRNVYDQIRDG